MRKKKKKSRKGTKMNAGLLYFKSFDIAFLSLFPAPCVAVGYVTDALDGLRTTQRKEVLS